MGKCKTGNTKAVERLEKCGEKEQKLVEDFNVQKTSLGRFLTVDIGASQRSHP